MTHRRRSEPRTEAHNRQILDRFLAPWFNCQTEVTGEWVHRPHGFDMTHHPRIDYIVEPQPGRLRGDWEWPLQRFGIEAKRDGAKMGPAFAQALDYRTLADYDLDMVFIYPYEHQSGPLGSIGSQSRVGTIELDVQESLLGNFRSASLGFYAGQHPLFTLTLGDEPTSTVSIHRHATKYANHGRRVGSR